MGVRWIIGMEMLGMPNICTGVSGGVNTSCAGMVARIVWGVSAVPIPAYMHIAMVLCVQLGSGVMMLYDIIWR
jgi:hypothetical protein